jgi:FlaA1/EpsC-like NDP-sugar epimerase
LAIKISSVDVVDAKDFINHSKQYFEIYNYVFPVLIVTTIPIMVAFRLYSRLWNFASINEAIQIIISGAISSVLFASITIILTGYLESFKNIRLPISTYVIYFFFVSSGFIFTRYAQEFLADYLTP